MALSDPSGDPLTLSNGGLPHPPRASPSPASPSGGLPVGGEEQGEAPCSSWTQEPPASSPARELLCRARGSQNGGLKHNGSLRPPASSSTPPTPHLADSQRLAKLLPPSSSSS